MLPSMSSNADMFPPRPSESVWNEEMFAADEEFPRGTSGVMCFLGREVGVDWAQTRCPH